MTKETGKTAIAVDKEEINDFVKDRMCKDFGLRKSDIVETPLQKIYREFIANDNKLGHFITIQMSEMMSGGKMPTWDNFCITVKWAAMGMNLSEDQKFKVGRKWREIYDELLAPTEESGRDDGGTKQPTGDAASDSPPDKPDE